MFEVGNNILAIAQKEVGTVENPRNSNRQKYGVWFGWNGVAWCCIFMSWLFWKAGSPFPPLQTPKGCAYVPTMVAHAKKTNQWRPKGSYKPKPGDMIIFQFTNRPDHIGIVKARLDDGRIWTIEGNTNSGGSRTGGGVWELYRRSGILGYIETKPKFNWTEFRRYIAGLVFDKVSKVKTRVPLDNSNKEDVKSVQEALNIILDSKLVTDGLYGPSTTRAVIEWQNKCRLMKLPVNDSAGIFGDSTKWWTCIALSKIRDGKA